MDAQLRKGATMSTLPYEKMLNSSLVRDRAIITPRCQCSTGLGKDQDAHHHTEGGRVPEVSVRAGRFWESELESRGLGPHTHGCALETRAHKCICGRTARHSKGLGRAFLPSNRDCSKCHRTRGKTDKINFFKTLEINQRPVTIQGGFTLEKWLSLGGKGKPGGIFSYSSHSLSPALQWLYTQQPWGHRSPEINSPAATGRGRLGPKAPPSETRHYWNRQAAIRKKPILQACLFFGPDSTGSVQVCREQSGILFNNEQPAVATSTWPKKRLVKNLKRPEKYIALTTG